METERTFRNDLRSDLYGVKRTLLLKHVPVFR